MNKLSIRFTLFTLLIFAGSQLFSQSIDSTQILQADSAEVATVQKTPKRINRAGKSTPSYYRHHKKLPATYSGYAIELVSSKLPLKRDYPVFQQFGNIHYEKLDTGGYAYVLLVKFSGKKALQNYIDQIIKAKAPEAKALVYKNGRRR